MHVQQRHWISTQAFPLLIFQFVDGRRVLQWDLIGNIPTVRSRPEFSCTTEQRKLTYRATYVETDVHVVQLSVNGWLLVSQEPIVVAAVRVPDDVIQDNQSFKLQLQSPLEVRRKDVRLEQFQLNLRVFVSLHKHLKRPHLGIKIPMN